MEILFEDDHVIAINKPTGVITAAQHARKATALDLTRETLKQRKSRDIKVFVVHEVDREASGVLVFARSHELAETLRRQFRSRKADRMYSAVVEGEWPEDAPATTTIRSRLIENRRGVAQSVPDSEAEPAGEGRPLAAVTHVRVQARGEGLTLVRLRAETDHPFQLRAHMAEGGHPVAGDKAYSAMRREFGRVALHLEEVSFEHPISGEKVRVRAPAPASFHEAVGRGAPTKSKAEKTVTAEGERRETHWDRVSEWYDSLLSERGSDHYEKILIPGTMLLADPREGERFLDIACGQGIVSRALAERGAAVLGVDGSEKLVERARELAGESENMAFHAGDAQDLAAVEVAEPGSFDAAVCIMALMNIEHLESTLAGAASMLKPGGRFVGVILHPAFRSPRLSAWGWEGSDAETQRQFRRVDAYLSPQTIDITMNPGARSAGAEAVTTATFHRPISAYVNACREAGLAVDAMEEWASLRKSAPGPRADEENRARAEIPMFLAFRAVKR